jgi:hypothetical protein
MFAFTYVGHLNLITMVVVVVAAEANDRLMRTRQWSFGFRYMRPNNWLDERLLAFLGLG